jgi:hypothetical protein
MYTHQSLPPAPNQKICQKVTLSNKLFQNDLQAYKQLCINFIAVFKGIHCIVKERAV